MINFEAAREFTFQEDGLSKDITDQTVEVAEQAVVMVTLTLCLPYV